MKVALSLAFIVIGILMLSFGLLSDGRIEHKQMRTGRTELGVIEAGHRRSSDISIKNTTSVPWQVLKHSVSCGAIRIDGISTGTVDPGENLVVSVRCSPVMGHVGVMLLTLSIEVSPGPMEILHELSFAVVPTAHASPALVECALSDNEMAFTVEADICISELIEVDPFILTEVPGIIPTLSEPKTADGLRKYHLTITGELRQQELSRSFEIPIILLGKNRNEQLNVPVFVNRLKGNQKFK